MSTLRSRPKIATTPLDALSVSFPVSLPRPISCSFRRSTIEANYPHDFDALLTATAILLSLHNDVQELAIGCLRVDLNGAHTLPLRLDLRESPTYGTVLKSVRTARREICRASHEDPNLLQHPSAATPIIAAAVHEPNLGRLSVDEKYLRQLLGAMASADVAFVLDRSDAGLRCNFDRDLFDERTVQNLLQQVVLVTGEGRAHPEHPITDLDLIGENERDELLTLATASGASDNVCIHHLISTQSQVRQDHPAVTFDGRDLSYIELDRQSNSLAHRLQEAGVRRGDRVGIRLERSLELVVAMLGTLKAGGAYVPIDPSLPEARQQQIARLADLDVLLASESSQARLGTRRVQVRLDDAGREKPPTVLSEPKDDAYVLFTSGSTGVPKGVVVSHASVARLFTTTKDLFDFCPSDVWLNSHSYAFDASVWEIFGALVHGARLVMPPREVTRDPEAMVSLASDEGVTILTTTPTAFDGFRDAALEEGDSLPAMRFIVLCAEALSFASLARWFERWGEDRPKLVNMYGITETTVHSTFYRIRKGDVRDPRRKLGRGLPDTPVYVLDSKARLVPFGVAGEIYVGGPGVASYVVASEEDRTRFSPDPFSPHPGARMYRSGDKGRWLPEGSVEYLGRLDHQVKIRGYRVELGEIEAVLLDHPEVRAARSWVIRRDDQPPVLAACYVAASGADLNETQLREFALRQLPDYMVPAGFVQLEEMPLTENGKLDVAGLPNLPAVRSPSEFVEAESPTELVVSSAMAAVLGIPQVSGDANFFELGGDSITAVRLAARLRESGLNAELSHVYEFRSARSIARVLESDGSHSATEIKPFGLIPKHEARWIPDEAVDAYPATRLQAGLLYHNALDGEHVYHDVFSYTVNGAIEETAFRRALSVIGEAHPVLRTSFIIDGPQSPLQIVHPMVGGPACNFIDSRSTMSADEVRESIEDWARRERNTAFDWRSPGLLRLFVHRTGERESSLSVSFHHAILDGWSVATLVTELLVAYTKIRDGQVPEVNGDARFLRQYVALEKAVEGAAPHRLFWQEYLEGAKPTEIPRLGVGARRKTSLDADVSVSIPAPVSNHLRELAQEAGVPVKTVYLAAHVALMAFVSGEPEVVTGLITGGRIEEERGDEALGLFLNTVPFRVANNDENWWDLIRAIFKNESVVYRHRRFPFEQIQAETDFTKLCPTAFNYTDFHIFEKLDSFGIRVRDAHYREKTDFLLLASVIEDPFDGSTTLTLTYEPGSMGTEQAEVYARFFGQLVRHATNAPDEPVIGSLASWAQTENCTAIVAPGPVDEQSESVLSLVMNQIEAHPFAMAQFHRDTCMTFQEVAARASQVRIGLETLGIKPGERVACFLEHGADPLVALLGTWAAGASYVPVDITLPLARQQAQVEAVGCSVALRSVAVSPDRRAWSGREIAIPGSDVPAIPHIDCWITPSPQQEAYVLFTSGSTGEPKAVSMSHGGLANLISWQVADPVFAEPRRVSQFASMSFDVSIQELLATAVSGGSLFVVPEDMRRNSQALLDFLAYHEIEVTFLPVAALHQLTGAWERFGVTPSALRCIITAGESLVVTDAVREFCEACRAEIINQYGPTETHVTTFHRLGSEPRSWPERPSIGRLIHNTTAVILDPRHRPVPRGTPGELYLGGASVASGYVDARGLHPLSAERFVSVDHEQGTFYRTGDIVRALENGDLEFIGRADDQVKIRGHRVEPGEVATIMMQHPGIRGCAVRALKLGENRLDLVAYVEAALVGITVEELISFARAALPEHAVPSHIEFLDRLPLTRSGKIDVKSLPPPKLVQPQARTRMLMSPTERRVLEVWEQVLGQAVLSPTQSFFEAGGNSLMLLQLHLRLCRVLELDFPMHALFSFPTAREFATFLDEGDQALQSDPDFRHAATKAPADIANVAARRRAARKQGHKE